MREYRVSKSKVLELFERALDFTNENDVKVKITKVLVDSEATAQFSSNDMKNLIPAAAATAVISEFNNAPQFKRGERVYVDPYEVCDACYECKVGKPSLCLNLKRAGKTCDGFLTEFKIVPADSIRMLPDSVTDDAALFIELVSRAINIIDTLSANKGEYLVVCGSDILSNILCQISLYYQIIPILVDNNSLNVEIAKKCGVYYTTPADANCVNVIRQITGGRMAENLVCLASSDLASKHVADCCAMHAKLVFSGESSGSFITYNSALKKQLTVSFVENGYGNLSSAINILANHAVNTEYFIREQMNFDDAQKAFDLQDSEEENSKLISAVVVNV